MPLSTNISQLYSNGHIMLLYSSDDERNIAAVNYINNGLKEGYHCIYASVNAYENESSSNISNLSSKIDNYKENIETGELQIIDFKPYYESALHGDITPFKKLKFEIEKTLLHRRSEGKKDAILAFADAACFLASNKYFDECERLEQWWHDTTNEWSKNNQNIMVVCPHSGLVLNDPFLLNKRESINAKHTITIDINDDLQKIKFKKNQNIIRVLVVEPEPDIQYLYRYFAKYNDFVKVDLEIVENGNKCLEYIFSSTDKQFDIVILDTHIRDISSFDIAKNIRNNLPNKRIILTTTYSINNISNIINSIGITSEEVILKPFSFSKLFSMIKSKNKYN